MRFCFTPFAQRPGWSGTGKGTVFVARTSDRDRILSLLAESPEGLSNQRIKNDLTLSDERYDKVRSELLDDGHVEKYVCRGGGIRLTPKGDKAAASSDENAVLSAVGKEEELYPLLIEALERESPDSVVFDTGRLRKRGKWQNPDVTQIRIERYPRLHKHRVLIATYEVKQWQRSDVTAVFEAESHARFAHEAYVVLEWPATADAFSLEEPSVNKMVGECQRFGVGLWTIEPYYSKHRVHEQLEARPRTPADADVEKWLDYALKRDTDALERYEVAIRKVLEEMSGPKP